MESSVETKNSWKGVKSLDEALELIDYGIIVKWREMRTLKRTFSSEDQAKILRHFAMRLCERVEDRLAVEIIVESVLIWIANTLHDEHINSFLEQVFSEVDHDIASKLLVEVALTGEVSDQDHDQEIYSFAVALICKLGISVREYEVEAPGHFNNAHGVLDHITTYLLSVSNNNNSCIRLSLLHYFGYICNVSKQSAPFNRIMSRFGHTVLDHLFALLFNKKSEAISLQYLVENLPYVLKADRHCQRILHETFKFYMLKKPERFSLFIQTFSDHMVIEGVSDIEGKKVFVQHLGALYKVVSEVNHKSLARELFIALQKFTEKYELSEVIKQMIDDDQLRKTFKDLLRQLLGKNNHSGGYIDSVSQFRSPKRGRKPSFSRVENIGTMGQVSFLGNLDSVKAS